MKIFSSCPAPVRGAFLGGLLGASALVPSAWAAPVTLTVSPSAAGLSNAPDYSFSGIRTSDFSSINLTSTGGGNFSFTELGFLPIASFDPGNFTPPGLNGTAPATPYGMYISFTAAGTLAPVAGSLQGSFSSLNYTLMGDPGFNSSFNSFSATHQVQCTGCAGDVTLASGTLLPGGTNVVSILSPSSAAPLPAAFVDLLFNGTSSSFFVSPMTPFTLALDTQFSNTANVTSQFTTGLPPGVDSVVTIGTTSNEGGSGTGQFLTITVPEPSSMLLIGTGLAALGMVSLRRKA